MPNMNGITMSTAGMNEYLTKPLNKKKLSEVLAKFL